MLLGGGEKLGLREKVKPQHLLKLRTYRSEDIRGRETVERGRSGQEDIGCDGSRKTLNPQGPI